MRTPQGEALRVVEGLSGQMVIVKMPEQFQNWPIMFFEHMISTDDPARDLAAFDANIAEKFPNAAHREYLLSVLRACTHAADCIRLQDRGWPSAVDAQMHAGIALAKLVSFADSKAVKSERGRGAKEAQTEANEAVRVHVLNEAAASPLETRRSAAQNIANRLGKSKRGGLKAALKKLGSNLQPEHESVAKAFDGYIGADMDRLVPLGASEKNHQKLSKIRFAQWKILYVSQANG